MSLFRFWPLYDEALHIGHPEKEPNSQDDDDGHYNLVYLIEEESKVEIL